MRRRMRSADREGGLVKPPGKSKWPTNKWWAATVTAIAGLLTTWATTQGWTKEMSGVAIALVGQRIVAYLVPNSDTPGGVPLKG